MTEALQFVDYIQRLTATLPAATAWDVIDTAVQEHCDTPQKKRAVLQAIVLRRREALLPGADTADRLYN